MVDVADRWMCKRLDFEVLRCLAQHPHIPAVLVLNKVELRSLELANNTKSRSHSKNGVCSRVFKVDRVKAKERLLDITAELTCGAVDDHRLQVSGGMKPEGETPADAADPGLSSEQLRALSRQKGWPHFKDIFMLSSVDSEDVETLKVQITRLLCEGMCSR